jgi:hypothetical protein
LADGGASSRDYTVTLDLPRDTAIKPPNLLFAAMDGPIIVPDIALEVIDFAAEHLVWIVETQKRFDCGYPISIS